MAHPYKADVYFAPFRETTERRGALLARDGNDAEQGTDHTLENSIDRYYRNHDGEKNFWFFTQVFVRSTDRSFALSINLF